MNIKAGLLFFCSFLIQLSSHGIFSRELIQIHTLTRHGERSPLFTFPSDPYKHMWVNGLGQLTETGILQMKQFGSFLRTHYRHFLPNTFNNKEIFVSSSDSDRTIISAQAAMSTLFSNQFVPIHTIPKSQDFILRMSANCPAYEYLLDQEFKTNDFQIYLRKQLPFFKQLQQKTGLRNLDFNSAWAICDTVDVWYLMKRPMPEWLKDESYDKCRRLMDKGFSMKYADDFLTKFKGSPLAITIKNNMITRAKSFLDSESGIKIIGYFAHDITIVALLAHLGSYNRIRPPVASSVILEVYFDRHAPIINREPMSQFFVQLLFRNDTTVPPYGLNIGICQDVKNPVQTYCRLDIFNSVVEKLAFKTLDVEMSSNANNDNKLDMKKNCHQKNVKTSNGAPGPASFPFHKLQILASLLFLWSSYVL